MKDTSELTWESSRKSYDELIFQDVRLFSRRFNAREKRHFLATGINKCGRSQDRPRERQSEH